MTCPRCEQLDLLAKLELRLDLTPMGRRILGLLFSQESVSREQIQQDVFAHLPLSGNNPVRVHICHLRNKLRPFGVEVTNLWGFGYEIDAENKKKLRDLCAQGAA